MAERLFEPFVTGRADGTGLGLAIARELADAHGGNLTLRLIADDDAAFRRAVATAVADMGHEAAETVDGTVALAWLSRSHADAVLLDLRIPGMDGMEVLRRMRARPSALPVAVITAVPTGENTIEAMRLGAVDHLAKPVGRDALATLLGRRLPLRPSASPRRPSRSAGKARWWDPARRCARSRRAAACLPIAMRPCCCWARPTRARRSWRARSILTAAGRQSLLRR